MLQKNALNALQELNQVVFTKTQTSLLFLVFVLALIAVPIGNETLSSSEVNVTPIERIWAEKASLENKMVVIHGEYRGWQDDVPNPLITRSDWIVRDHTGAIYVTGKCPERLDPVRDIGTKITVKGVIKVSKDGVPYIKAEEVMVKE